MISQNLLSIYFLEQNVVIEGLRPVLADVDDLSSFILTLSFALNYRIVVIREYQSEIHRIIP